MNIISNYLKKHRKNEDLYIPRFHDFCFRKINPNHPGYIEDSTLMLKGMIIKQNKKSLEDKIKIEITQGKVIDISMKLCKLAKVIEESKYILKLHNNFDGEDSKGYQFSTWERVIYFLVNYFNRALDYQGILIESPNIYHGPDGSIDILWQTERYKLLISIPEEQEAPASFYGDDFKMNKIKGTFDTSIFNPGLLMLLSEL